MVNIFSAQIASDSSFTVQNCRVSTVEDVQLAADELAPAAIGSAFFGLDGDIYFEDCHVFFALAVRPLKLPMYCCCLCFIGHVVNLVTGSTAVYAVSLLPLIW